jgi:hypothetical protein
MGYVDGGMCGWVEDIVRTALLDALDSGTRNSPVYSLGGILDCLHGALARNGCGAEEAGLAGNLLAEHVDCVCGDCFGG